MPELCPRASITPELLAEAGRVLFGDHWRRPMAELMSVERRTIHRWASGESRIPVGVRLELLAAVAGKAVDAKVLLDKLKAAELDRVEA